MKNRTKHLLTAACLWACASGVWAQGTPDIMWQKGFGSFDYDEILSIDEELDRTLLLGMLSYSSSSSVGQKGTPNYGASDYWIGKVDENGNGTGISPFIWEQNYGSNNKDELKFAYVVAGFDMIGGTSYGTGGNRNASLKGVCDAWVMRLRANDGTRDWEESYGGSGEDRIEDMVENGNNYVFVISSNSPASATITPASNKLAPNIGGFDIWLVETDLNGVITNQKTYGGLGDDKAYKIIKTSDEGYLITGTTQSGALPPNKTSSTFGLNDVWVIKLDSNFQILWEKTFGGIGTDEKPIALEDRYGKYWVACTSDSPISPNKTMNSYNGSKDNWILKLDNTNGNVLYQRLIGGGFSDVSEVFIKTNDDHFLLGSSTLSGATFDKSSPTKGLVDCWIIKMNDQGNILWQKTIGAANLDDIHTMIQTSDDNIVWADGSLSATGLDKTTPNLGLADGWLVKLFNSGYWDYRYQAANVWSHHSIMTNNLTEGNDHFWSISSLGQSSYWLLGVDKTSGMTLKSFQHDFLENTGHTPIINDFGGELLVAGQTDRGFIKYEINKSTGSSIFSNKTEVYMSMGSYYEEVEMYPVEFLEWGNQKMMLGILDNQNIRATVGLVLFDPITYAVNAISHINDPMMSNTDFIPTRAIVIPGNELLIVGCAVTSGTSSIFSLKFDLNTGTVASPIRYYAPSTPGQFILPADITVVEFNGEYRISYSVNNGMGAQWPGVLYLNSNLMPVNSYYYMPNMGTPVIGGHSGEIIVDNQDIIYTTSIILNSSENPVAIKLDGNTGVSSPLNYLYHHQTPSQRAVSSTLKTSNDDVLMVTENATYGKSLILTNLDAGKIAENACVEEFSVTDVGINFSTIIHSLNVTQDMWNESTINIISTPETGVRYSCENSANVSYKRKQTKPTSTTSVFDIITEKEEIDVKVWRSENPGVFNVKSEEDIQSIKVFDMIGKLVFSTHKSSTSQQVNLAHMPSGVYIFQVETLTGMRSEKVVK